MGSCISSPEDLSHVQTSVKTVQNGSDEAALIYNGNMNTSSRITLSFECTGLPKLDLTSKSDPFIVVYMQDCNKNWNEIGRTEVVVNSQTPKFVQKILIMYKFEEIQKLRFVVYDADTEGTSTSLDLSKQDLIGEVQCDLPTLVHSINVKNYPILLNNKNRGELIVKCEELHQSSGDVKIQLASEGIPKNTFVEISNILFTHLRINEKNGVIPVYKTEVSQEGNWKEVCVDIAILCNCDSNRPIILKVFQYKRSGDHKLVGEYKSSVNELLQMSGKTVVLTGEKAEGSLKITRCAFEEKASFLQFVQNGLDINFMVAIDFTGSNRDPSMVNSLHYYNQSFFEQGKLNQYERAIAMIGNVIEFYDTDRMFPVYGFGACQQSSFEVNHCFALNGNEGNPEVPGVAGIMSVYHSSLPYLRFSGPTFFAPVLSKAATIASLIQQQRSKYLILLIITDGEIHDMEATIRLLVDSSILPLSVLIVGVGDADFTNMETLDGDEDRLHYNNKYASRDIVQFMAMRDVLHFPPEAIAQQLLEEIPLQVTEYMKSRGITPSTLH